MACGRLPADGALRAVRLRSGSNDVERVSAKLLGGSDIVIEMFESGELAGLLGVEQPEAFETEPQPEPVKRPIGLENRLD